MYNEEYRERRVQKVEYLCNVEGGGGGGDWRVSTRHLMNCNYICGIASIAFHTVQFFIANICVGSWDRV